MEKENYQDFNKLLEKATKMRCDLEILEEEILIFLSSHSENTCQYL